MLNILTKRTYLLFYIINGILAEPPLRNPVILQTPAQFQSIIQQIPGFETTILKKPSQSQRTQSDQNNYLVNYFVEKQQSFPQQTQANSYVVPQSANYYAAPDVSTSNSYGAPAVTNTYAAPTVGSTYGAPAPGNTYATPDYGVPAVGPSNTYAEYGAPAPGGQAFFVQTKKAPNYKSVTKPFSFTVRNVTTNLGGKLDLPYGERVALGFTFPPLDESNFASIQNSYGPYGQADYFAGHENPVKLSGETPINFGSIVMDTFVLKERTSGSSPASSDFSSRPSFTNTNLNRASILNGILNTVIEKGPRAINITSSSSSNSPQRRGKEEIHTPGDFIAKEIPLNGKMDFSSLDNLTEFLIEDATKFSPTRRQFPSKKDQVPMFVAVQFNTVGRNKFKSFDEGSQKNSRIHVVLGHKHFSYKNIKNLNELYDFVSPDYQPYQPNNDHGYNYFSAQPKFRISKTVIDLIIEFVEFSWKVHQDTNTATEARGKDITKRITKQLRQTSKNRPRFRPNKSPEHTVTDFFTWAYTNTLGYRTLV